MFTRTSFLSFSNKANESWPCSLPESSRDETPTGLGRVRVLPLIFRHLVLLSLNDLPFSLPAGVVKIEFGKREGLKTESRNVAYKTLSTGFLRSAK